MLGEKVRYDGADAKSSDPVLARWLSEQRVLSYCPETAGNLPVPRSPAEIVGPGGGTSVLARSSRVLNSAQIDVTEAFILGATATLNFALKNKVVLAVLKEGSPSCGSKFIYDGSFSKQRVIGIGVTTALLIKNNIRVFSDQQWPEAERYFNNNFTG